MKSRDDVIKGLECHKRAMYGEIDEHGFACNSCPYKDMESTCRSRTEGDLISDALALLKDSGQDEGWLCEKRTSGRQTTDLLCACGNKVYFTTLLFNDGFTANELYCPNCGLSMRSPHHDKDGVWLRKHWEEVVLKAQEPRVLTLEEVIEHYSLPPVFPDDLGMQEDYYEDIQPLYFEFLHDNEDPWLVHWRGHSKVARYLDNRRHTYNQKWRCWTSRPDKATREATPWNV